MNVSRRALLVSVPTYDEPSIADLPVTLDDARLLGTALGTSGYEIESLGTAERSPTHNQILTAVRRFCKAGKKGETLLVYFSSHGIQYEGINYVLPSDASLNDPARLPELLVPLSFADVVDETQADLVLFVIDACRQGFNLTASQKAVLQPWNPAKIQEATRRDSVYIFSCAAGQYSEFVEQPESFSLFTSAFAQVMGSEHPASTVKEVLDATQERLHELSTNHGRNPQNIQTRGEFDVEGRLYSRRIAESGVCAVHASTNSEGALPTDHRMRWRRFPRLASLENVIDLDQEETHRTTVAKRRRWTWLTALGFEIAAITALALMAATASPADTVRGWLFGLSAVVIASMGTAIIILNGQYKRLRHYQEALPEIHHLGHELRDQLAKGRVARLRAEAKGISALEPGSTPGISHAPDHARVLFRLLHQIMILFQRLAGRGEIHVTMLVPSGTRRIRNSTHLEVAGWSPTQGTILPRERRARHRKSKLGIATSLAGYVYEKRRSVLIRDLDRALTRNELPVFELSPTTRTREDVVKYVRSHIGIPLVALGDVYGVLCIDSTKPYDFHADYIEVGRLCADLVAHVLSLAGYGEELLSQEPGPDPVSPAPTANG